jgi:hypothetical protein
MLSQKVSRDQVRWSEIAGGASMAWILDLLIQQLRAPTGTAPQVRGVCELYVLVCQFIGKGGKLSWFGYRVEGAQLPESY